MEKLDINKLIESEVKRDSNKQCILERVFQDELYHATTLNNLYKILKQDALNLSFTSFSDVSADSLVNKEKHFFLSMSQDKYGRYARADKRIDLSHKPPYDVVFNMNTNMIGSFGKLIDVNYWGDLRRDYDDDEKEIRLVSNKQSLTPLEKYINSIHVYVDKYDNNSKDFRNEYISKVIKEIVKLSNNIQTPIFFYESPAHFKLQILKKSKTPEEVMDIISGKDLDEDEMRRLTRNDIYGKKQLEGLIEILKDDNVDDYSEDAKKIFNMTRYHWDFVPSMDATLHNFKRTHDPILSELVRWFSNRGIKSMKDLQEFVTKKANDYYNRNR